MFIMKFHNLVVVSCFVAAVIVNGSQIVRIRSKSVGKAGFEVLRKVDDVARNVAWTLVSIGLQLGWTSAGNDG